MAKYNGLKGRKIIMFFVATAALLASFFGGAFILQMPNNEQVVALIGNNWGIVLGVFITVIGVLANAIAQHNQQDPNNADGTGSEVAKKK